MSDLVLNAFPVDIAPTRLTLPVHYYSNWAKSKDGFAKELRSSLVHRFWEVYSDQSGARQGRVVAVVFSAPRESNDQLETREFDFGEHPTLARKIAEYSIAEHLRRRGFRVSRTSFEMKARAQTPAVSRNGVEVRTGLNLRVHRPFKSDLYKFVLSATWEVSAAFAISLGDPKMLPIAKGMPAIYNPSGRVNDEQLHFVSRYIGIVREVEPPDAIVTCKDGVTRRLKLSDLFAEARPDSIRRYESHLGLRTDSRSLWRTIQQLKFVLTSEGRRNPSVYRDRLRAVREALGPSSSNPLLLPILSSGPGTITIDLTPTRVGVN